MAGLVASTIAIGSPTNRTLASAITGDSNGKTSGTGNSPDRDARHRPPNLSSRDNRMNAGNRKGLCNVQRAYVSVRDGAAQYHGMELAIEVDIVAERALATEKSQIFDPFNGLADH